MTFNMDFLTFSNIILSLSFLGVIYALYNNSLLYHRNTFIKYLHSKYSVKKDSIKLKILNLSVIIITIFLVKVNITFDVYLTILSILTSAIFFMLGSINNNSIIKFYKNLNKKNAIPSKKFSETNNLAAGTLFIGTILIIFIISAKILGYENNIIINKIIIMILFVFMQNFLIIIRRFTTIYCKYFDDNNL